MWLFSPACRRVCRCVPCQPLQSALAVIRQSQPLHRRLRNGNGFVVARLSSPAIWERQGSHHCYFSFLLFPVWIPSTLSSLAGRGRGEQALPSPPPFPASVPTPNTKTRIHPLTRTYTVPPQPPSVPELRWRAAGVEEEIMRLACVAALFSLGLVAGTLGRGESWFTAAGSSAS